VAPIDEPIADDNEESLAIVFVEQLRVFESLGAENCVQERIGVVGRIGSNRLPRLAVDAVAVLRTKLRECGLGASFGSSHRRKLSSSDGIAHAWASDAYV
jgi:hypothetical protein